MNCSHEVQDGSLPSIVLWIRLMGIDSCDASRDYNLAPRDFVLAHEMNGELCAIDHSLIVDISAKGVRRRRYSSITVSLHSLSTCQCC